MASLFNFNNLITINNESLDKRSTFFEDQKSDVYFKKPIQIPNQHYFINNQEKLSSYFIPSIVKQIGSLEMETEQLEKEIRSIQITKQLKALKIKDLRNVIERISEEDYYDRFMDQRRLFNLEKQSKSSSLQGKGKPCCTTNDDDCSVDEATDEQGSEQDGAISDSDHLSNCILYWSQVVNMPVPNSNSFRV